MIFVIRKLLCFNDNSVMDDSQKYCNISEEDLRAALSEMKTYIDVTEEDLRKIYEIALKHARQRLAARTTVGEIMTRIVIAVKKEDDFHEAARLLSEHNISGLPVVDEENIVVGVVSEADILSTAGMKKGHTFKDILRHIFGEPLPERREGNKIKDIMASPAITAKADDDIKEAARILDEQRIKRLPVVDDENRLIGIISRADIVRAIGGSQ